MTVLYLVEASELSVFLPNEKPFGLTYGEWSAEWWKWLLSSPSESNPSTDKTGNIVRRIKIVLMYGF